MDKEKFINIIQGIEEYKKTLNGIRCQYKPNGFFHEKQ